MFRKAHFDHSVDIHQLKGLKAKQTSENFPNFITLAAVFSRFHSKRKNRPPWLQIIKHN